MAALAAIHNPNDRTESLLFFCAEDQQVGIDRRKEDADEGRGAPVRNAPDGKEPVENEPALGTPLVGDIRNSDSPKGVVKNPSSFGAVFFRKLTQVYGIRIDGAICQVSPAFQPVLGQPKTDFNCMAACGDGNSIGWLYYLASDPGVIHEYRLSPGASMEVPGQPSPDTYLCAYYDASTTSRYCIYQVQGSLSIVDAGTGQGGLIKNTTNVKAKSPLAVCITNGKVYLYYSDQNNALVRISRTGGGVWGSPSVVSDAPPLDDGTQMAVTTSVNGSFNMVFYIVKNSGSKYYKQIDLL